jgi:para-nitrobenzyl esterase
VKTENDRQILFIGDNIALADTQYGKVKGYVLRVLDDVSEVKNDPDREARKALPST